MNACLMALFETCVLKSEFVCWVFIGSLYAAHLRWLCVCVCVCVRVCVLVFVCELTAGATLVFIEFVPCSVLQSLNQR